MAKDKYNDLIIELINLREQDYNKFMDKLYEAITGEFKSILNDDSSIAKKINSLNTMIFHFEDKEEYEKCAKIKELVDSLDA
ncbi:MAG: hypothetical protein WC123_04980 [Bacilli bacterium]|jgi:hypothetical protein